ncbi:MAG: SIS domain-containing protein [Clostridiales bacterium]|nr:SIS domain-containing protein [Clostridiales bacterium]
MGKTYGALSPALKKHVDTLITRYPILAAVREDLVKAFYIMEESYSNDGKLLIAGNGGSAADSEHIAGELMKSFKLPRPVPLEFAEKLVEADSVRGAELAQKLERGLMAIPLVAQEALTTAYLNDVDGFGVFAQQLYGYGRPGDVFLGISTSGNSENIINAVTVARASDIKVIGLTGADGGELANMADVAVRVPERETFKVQELHLPVYHCWCMMLEERFFSESIEKDQKAVIVGQPH